MTVQLAATATDRGGAISKVEFYDGNLLLGEDTTAPYALDLINRSAGIHRLSARAYDNHGAVTISQAVSISIGKTTSTR